MIDVKNISNIEIEGIDPGDYPDFCDAFVSYAEINGRELTEEEYEELEEHSDYTEILYDGIVGEIY